MKKLITILAMCIIITPTKAQLFISSGSSLTLIGSSEITLHDINLVNNGTLVIPSNGKFTFNGTANSNISGSAVPTFVNFEIAKSASAQLILQNDIKVTGNLIFTSNLLELNNHKIDLGNSGLLVGENENSRIIGSTGGEVLANAMLNAPSNINPGNLGAVITSTQNLGFTNIQRGHKIQNSIGGGNSIKRYYDINPTNNTGLNATLKFNYFEAEINGLNEGAFELWKSNDNIVWLSKEYSNRNTTSNYVEKENLNDFSRWTLSPKGVLPISEISLSGKWMNNVAKLKWVAYNTNKNDYFIIERMYNNEFKFVEVGKEYITKIKSNISAPNTYLWTDNAKQNNGAIKYRIQYKKVDNQSYYSNIIIINPSTTPKFIVKIHPSKAVNNQLFITVGSLNLSNMRVQIYDIVGKNILNKNLKYQSQWISIPSLASGIYKIVILSERNKWNSSFIKK